MLRGASREGSRQRSHHAERRPSASEMTAAFGCSKELRDWRRERGRAGSSGPDRCCDLRPSVYGTARSPGLPQVTPLGISLLQQFSTRDV